jgi:hypothetical protein
MATTAEKTAGGWALSSITAIESLAALADVSPENFPTARQV